MVSAPKIHIGYSGLRLGRAMGKGVKFDDAASEFDFSQSGYTFSTASPAPISAQPKVMVAFADSLLELVAPSKTNFTRIEKADAFSLGSIVAPQPVLGGTEAGGLHSDFSHPYVRVSLDKSTLARGGSGKLTYTFSEVVTGFEVADIVASQGAIANLQSSDNITWTAEYRVAADAQIGSHVLGVRQNTYTDSVGNLGAGGFAVLNVIDLPPAPMPSVRITLSDTMLACSESCSVRFSFSEKISGFGGEDVVVSQGMQLNNLVQLDDLNWMASMSSTRTAENGYHYVYVRQGSYMANSSGALGASGLASLQLDQTAPVAHISMQKTLLSVGQRTGFSCVFSEKVSGFDAQDLFVSQGSVSGLTSTNGLVWTGEYTATANTQLGWQLLGVKQNSYTDLIGNKGAGSYASFTVQAPSDFGAQLSIHAGDGVPVAGVTSSTLAVLEAPFPSGAVL